MSGAARRANCGVHWLLARRASDRPLPASEATSLDHAMMARALALAQRAGDAGEAPVGAVVYRLGDGAVVGEASNTRERDKDPAAHAELLAIRLAASTTGDWRLNACGLAVTLEPCAMCAGLIVQARVGRVVFGAMDPKAGWAGSLGNLLTDRRGNHRVRPVAGVMEERCAQLLREFFAARRAAKRPSRAARDAGPAPTGAHHA
jgi:tRNA(adenine34) deaminase